MTEFGLAAFAKRDEKRSGIYSYEQEPSTFDASMTKQFKADKTAWDFYRSQAPWYQRTSTHWVVSAKKPETRARRLDILIACSRKGERIPMLSPPSKPPK